MIANLYRRIRAFADLPNQVAGTQKSFDVVETRLASLETTFDSLQGALDSLQTALGAEKTAIDTLRASIDALQATFGAPSTAASDEAAVSSETLIGLSRSFIKQQEDAASRNRETASRFERDMNSLRRLFLHARGVPCQRRKGEGRQINSPEYNHVAEPISGLSRDDAFRFVQENYPQAFRLWEKLVQNATTPYLEHSDQNLSTEVHQTAVKFRDYVAKFSLGRVLDLGCGPLSVPYYLEGLDKKRVAGIDPLEPVSQHPFMFRIGVAEAIPWQDECFETVIAATSLDHVISLRKALDETRRVLSDGGRFIIWAGFIPGGRPFDPLQNDPKEADEYHLFHLDQSWLEEMLEEYFLLEHRTWIEPNQAFYVFRKLDVIAAEPLRLAVRA